MKETIRTNQDLPYNLRFLEIYMHNFLFIFSILLVTFVQKYVDHQRPHLNRNLCFMFIHVAVYELCEHIYMKRYCENFNKHQHVLAYLKYIS